MKQKRLPSHSKAARNRIAPLAVVALVLAAGYVAIGQQAPAPAPQPSPAPSTAGLKAYIDPATGQLRPAEQEEMQQPEPASLALQPATRLAAPAPEPQTFRHPSGAIGLHVGPDQMVFSVATIGADGKLRYECVRGESAANQKLGAPSQGGLDVE